MLLLDNNTHWCEITGSSGGNAQLHEDGIYYYSGNESFNNKNVKIALKKYS